MYKGVSNVFGWTKQTNKQNYTAKLNEQVSNLITYKLAISLIK